jgi:hypothetical protein
VLHLVVLLRLLNKLNPLLSKHLMLLNVLHLLPVVLKLDVPRLLLSKHLRLHLRLLRHLSKLAKLPNVLLKLNEFNMLWSALKFK